MSKKEFKTSAEELGASSVKSIVKDINKITKPPKEPKVAKIPKAIVTDSSGVAPVPKKKRVISDEQKEVLKARLVKAREAKVLKKNKT